MGGEERVVDGFYVYNAILCEDYKGNISVGAIQFGDGRPDIFGILCEGDARPSAIR
jgi:hypothetical protein